jgi:hypothetical protein
MLMPNALFYNYSVLQYLMETKIQRMHTKIAAPSILMLFSIKKCSMFEPLKENG